MPAKRKVYFGKTCYNSLRELVEKKSLAPYDCVRKRIKNKESVSAAISRPAHQDTLTERLEVIYLYLTDLYTPLEISQILKISTRRVRDIINQHIMES